MGSCEMIVLEKAASVTYRPRGHTSESEGSTADDCADSRRPPGVPGGQHVVTILRGHIQIKSMAGIKGLADIT